MIGVHGADSSDLYRDFAELEARGASDVYEAWALEVAEDVAVCRLLDGLDGRRRQPNLIFAAARLHGLAPTRDAGIASWLTEHWDEIRPTLDQRRTQTNEAARCATLLPAFSEIDGPLALIEVGASAGLALLPDLYSYRYLLDDGTEQRLHPASGPSPVQLTCRLSGVATPSLPDVAWRAGIDLNPLDAADPDTRDWLELLVWPGQDERRDRLRKALLIAADVKPLVVTGDLLGELEALVRRAPADATVVVFHSAVLAYVAEPLRRDFEALVRDLGVHWISNESQGVFPWLGTPVAPRPDGPGQFVVAVNGQPRGWAQAHGHAYVC